MLSNRDIRDWLPRLHRGGGRACQAFFLALLAALFAIYSTTLLLPYAYLDDYSHLYNVFAHPLGEFKSLADQGRPLNGLILLAVFRHIGGLPGMWKARALTLIGLACLAWIFHAALRANGWRTGAFLFTIILCTVPAVQVYAAWATSVQIPLAGICAVTAALVAALAVENLRHRWPVALAAAALMLIAATIYQPAA
ncbi:MAG TPA: hypothetical protein VMD30_14490, partial [Tepidisphaeraceae bacterium]|nr:hypothetical protein [Tepidisphaeraceae bacterium]